MPSSKTLTHDIVDQHNSAFLAVIQWNIDRNDHFPTDQSMTVGTLDYKIF